MIKQRIGLAILFLLAMCAIMPTTSIAQQSCESLTNLKLQDTIITSATSVLAGPFKLTPIPTLSSETSTDLPAFCRVVGTIKPTQDSDIRFEVWLPASGWNGRFLQMGNAGFAGAILPLFLTRPLANGYAVAATDDGHQGFGTAWAIGHPEKVIDFAYRAVHLTSEKSKEIIKSFYGTAQKYSYFNGCSEGGREALMEAQRYPDDFDGIISGNPGHVWNHLFFSGIWNNRAFQSDPASYLPPAKFALVEKAAVAACDTKDGVEDGIISDPISCDFNASSLLCKGAESDSCLTEAQVTALKKIYSGPQNSRTGERINFGIEPGVETLLTPFSPAPGSPKVPGLADLFFSGMVFENPKWNVQTLNFDESVAFTDKKLGFLNATNPDLSKFKASGGKLLHYHGWRDQGVPPMTSVDYYESVMTDSKGLKNTQNFYRLFMVPGMNHCSGGPGPNSFGNIFAPPPPDAENDIQKSIERWVEKGIAPNKIVATKYTDDDPKKSVVMTRPLCPYPQQARWTGKGSANDAANFTCKDVKVTRKAKR